MSKLIEKSENPETVKALKKTIAAAMKTVGKFKPELCEECLTTKYYKFPQTNLMISASTYSTDESMQSTNIDASIMFGIVVTTKPKADAIHALNNSSVEITFDDNTDVVELRKNLIVNRKRYVVGMTCHFKEEKKEEEEKSNLTPALTQTPDYLGKY